MNELLKKSLWRGTLLYIYAFLGGWLFYVIEKKAKNNRDVSLRLSQELRHEFANQYNISVSEGDFEQFVQKAFEAVQVGKKPDWSILTGVTFTITSLTTIGYGHITPETPPGQVLTVLYCLIGLPISMLTLKTLGEIISRIVYKVVYWVETKVCGKERPQKVKIKSFFVTTILMMLTICAGGPTQKYVEGWTFVQGIYVWFATLSTIGYGDYVPMWDLLREDGNSLTSLWLIIYSLSLPSMAALAVVSGLLNSLVEALEEFRIHFNASLKCVRCQKKNGSELKEEIEINEVPLDNHGKADLNMRNERVRSASV